MTDSKQQEKPSWFKGAWYSSPEEVTNPFSGESCLLTGAEASMYDFIMGATYTIEVTFDMDSDVETKKNRIDKIDKAISNIEAPK